MRSPLDGFKVDPLAVHFVKRAHVAQMVDSPDYIVDDEINFFFGVESA
jgi:hypothetical protein